MATSKRKVNKLKKGTVQKMLKSKYFDLGQLVMTFRVADTLAEDVFFAREVISAVRRYCNMEWDEMCPEDRFINYRAIIKGNDRIFASYKTSAGKIYIITECDRSATTVLFADEY